jgi:hypothetical protein
MLVSLVLAGCSSEYGLDRVTAVPPEVASTPATATADTPPAGVAPARVAEPMSPRFTPVSVDGDGGSAVSAEEDASGTTRRETFELGGGATTPVADFLFVVDDSVSMQLIVDRVRAAFATLGDGSAFPKEARIAVMSTLPADPDNLQRVNVAAMHRQRNQHDPGFLRLIDKVGIADFAKWAPPDQRAHFSHPGCDGAWFSPTDLDASGVSCLVAHTQLAMDNVHVEAGLTAFGQLLERRDTLPLFRPGAAANVIFVSDTQDPGLNADDKGFDALVAARPDFQRLSDLVDVANTVSSFRIHAIAPESQCAEHWSHIGEVYQQAAKASGGRTLDVCSATDYRAFIEAIGKDGAVVQRPVLALGKAMEDAQVEVDGQRVGYSASVDGRAITLDGALANKKSRVTVTYKVHATAPTPKVEAQSKPTDLERARLTK